MLQECKLRYSEIVDLNNKSEDYKFHTLLPEHVAKDFKEKLMLTTKKVEYGLAIGVRREDNTKIELLDRVDNGYFAMVRDGVLIMNIYLPQQGRGEDKLTQALAKIKPVLQEHSGMETFLAGDFNVSLNQKKGPERVSLLEEMTNNAGLKKTLTISYHQL